MYLIFNDGSKVNISNQFMTGPFAKRYLKMDATFVDGATRIHAPLLDTCENCHQFFTDQPRIDKFLSENRELNRSLNRPARVCILCYYRPYYDSGHIVPAPLRPFF